MRYVGQYLILERIWKEAYKVEWPNAFAGVHNIFHVSHLKKCVRDPKDVAVSRAVEDLVVETNMIYVKKPIRIIIAM